MNIFYIIMIVIWIVVVLILITCMTAHYFPWLFEPNEYKVWKECYKNDNWVLANNYDDVPELKNRNVEIEEYESKDLPYVIIVFYDEEPRCVIFDEHDNMVFSSFFILHSRKMCKKLCSLKS